MDISFWQLLSAILIAVIGWIAGHWFNTRRDLANKRRDLRLPHLIEMYRLLTTEISHRPQSSENTMALENMLTEIQLFGSARQIRLATSMIDEYVAARLLELDPLINDLRADLRKQLRLETIQGNVKWLRVTSESDNEKQ